MQWLIVPAVLASIWFFNLIPSCPGFAFVIIGFIYLIACHLENLIRQHAAASAARYAALVEKLEIMECHIEQKIDGLNAEIDDLKFEVKMK
ncbi:hypothetical protein ACV5Z5_004644 [Salmonella enterica subsp. enterica]